MGILEIMVAFMIIGSVIAIETRDLLSSVISVSAVGLALSILYMMLGALDIAITQVIVEVICLVILIRATVRRDDTTIDRPRDILAVATGLVFGGFVMTLFYVVLKGFPRFGEPVMRVSQEYVTNGMALTGSPNIVTAILLDFRAYDTIGEATVLFASIVGAIAILRKQGRKA